MDILKYDIKMRLIEGKKHIYDILRKKYLVLTPEELVRQKFLMYLLEEKGYPKSLCKTESGMKLGELRKRTDILFYHSNGEPYLLVECKSFKTSLTQKAFDQLSSYNQTIKAKFIGITNGISHHFCKVDYTGQKLIYLPEIPEYDADT